jgi:hypothetical protein
LSCGEGPAIAFGFDEREEVHGGKVANALRKATEMKASWLNPVEDRERREAHARFVFGQATRDNNG